MTDIGDQILVLNKSWMAIATTTHMRAFSLVYREHARIVDATSFELHTWDSWVSAHSKALGDGEPCHEAGWIRTPRMKIRLPSVITLATYGGVPARSLPFSRRSLYKRDGHACQYCGLNPGTRNLTIDHVMPRSRGGQTDWLNCVVACVQCNVRKGNRTPEESGSPLRRAPYRPSILEGFRICGKVPEPWAKFLPAAT
jgi:5-methylcytosine-specific restriction endonuclease McrA